MHTFTSSSYYFHLTRNRTSKDADEPIMFVPGDTAGTDLLCLCSLSQPDRGGLYYCLRQNVDALLSEEEGVSYSSL